MDEKKWRQTAGRLLAGFLIIMIIGTVLSRAADSFLVARVQTAKPSGRSLVSRFTGTGELEPERERGVYPPNGFVIEEVLAEAGSVVEEGTPLFRYEEGSLRDALERVRSEYRDLELQYEEMEQAMPKAGKQEDGTIKAAEQGVKQAKEGVKQAEKGVKQAEKQVLQAEKGLEEAEQELAEVEADLLLLKEESREELLEARQETLELAAEALLDAQQAEADGKEEAAYQREQAQNVWVELQRDWERTEEKFNAYADLVNETGTSSLGVGEPAKKKRELLDSLYIIMYGGTEGYQNHKDEVTNQALSGNQLALNQVLRRDNAFEGALKAYAKAVKAVKEAAGEAPNNPVGSPSVGGVSDTVLEEKRETQAECLEEVWRTLLSQEGLDAKRKELQEAEEELGRQRRAEEKTVRTLEAATDKAYQKWKKASEALEAVQNGTYDYKKELASGEQAKKAAEKSVEAAKKTIEDAKEGLEDAKEAVEEAKQEVKEQEGELQKTRQEIVAENGEKAKEIEESRELSKEKLEVLKEQLIAKKQEKKELETLIKEEGLYRSEIAGTITRCGLEAGTTYAGGQAAFRIGTGRLVYQAQIDKEAEGRVEAGDEVTLTFSGKSKGVTVLVSDLTQRVKDGEEILELTAELPEDGSISDGSISDGSSDGGYRAGRQASYTLEKRSDYYSYCIPLGALRENNDGHFVLVLRERDRILGKEQYVVQIPVTLLAVDGSFAAIDGGISEQDEVITSSSRTLSEGDRIRKKE